MWTVLHRLHFSVTRLSCIGARCSRLRPPRFAFAVAALRCAVSSLCDGFKDKPRRIFCNRSGGYTSGSRVATFRGCEGAKGSRPRDVRRADLRGLDGRLVAVRDPEPGHYAPDVVLYLQEFLGLRALGHLPGHGDQDRYG